MHSLNTFFDKIFCINLVDSKKRREEAQARFDKLGIDVEFFTAVKYGFYPKMLELFKEHPENGHDFNFPGELGCAQSHYSIIKKAKYQGYKNVLIFEDDIVFLKGFNELIQEYLDLLPENWDVVYFYSGLYKWTGDHYHVQGAEGKLFTSSEINGCIAYGVNQKFYDVYLERMNNSFQISDNFLNRTQKLFKYNFYSVLPNLCAQEINNSNINPDTHAIINVFPYMKTFQGKGPQDYE